MKSFKVRARPGVLVPVPQLAGDVARYVGRDVAHHHFANTKPRFDGTSMHLAPVEEDNEVLYPISADPTEVNAQVMGFHAYQEIARAVRHGDLLPADESSARVVGVKLAAAPTQPAKDEV